MNPGDPDRQASSVVPRRRLPTSRAYWELKAEQMLNRLFDPEPVTDLVIDPAPAEPPAAIPAPVPAGALVVTAARRRDKRLAAAQPAAAANKRTDLTLPLLGVLGGVCVVSVSGSLLLVSQWSQQQQNLRQERNLLLLERLRSLGPANPTPTAVSDGSLSPLTLPQRRVAAGSDLPPPPPDEPWIQQLSELPPPQRSASLLRVPVSPTLRAPAPATSATTAAPDTGGRTPPRAGGGPLPQLVGVVAAQGRATAAIFQVGGSSSSVNVGNVIPGTSWRLQAAEGDSATIERGGEQRRLSISNGE